LHAGETRGEAMLLRPKKGFPRKVLFLEWNVPKMLGVGSQKKTRGVFTGKIGSSLKMKL
jgi:hypothetical protein